MSCAKSASDLRAEILAARDNRETMIHTLLAEGAASLVFVSLAIPGPDKNLPGSEALFRWALARLQPAQRLVQGWDVLGRYQIVALNLDPVQAKRRACAIEDRHPAARLLDLDVYGPDGRQWSRTALGGKPRPCLLCHEPAGSCIRLQRHAPEAVIAHAKHLLTDFGHPAAG
ncbi:MAG: citrate lyase holo-[acyl-carrier protein] synthase [Candidatus Competibacteraceae bacterium]|nr:citrate lyase holo-[acyl-carrier protein] synthase [Candidatus Competibacteraceae bacterium]